MWSCLWNYDLSLRADFISYRGRGPLKTTMDVINAAKKISEAGTKLDKLTRQIADQCPESSTKKDLLAYLQRIALYCHQMNITSKVKADVQNISGELIVSGVRTITNENDYSKTWIKWKPVFIRKRVWS